MASVLSTGKRPHGARSPARSIVPLSSHHFPPSGDLDDADRPSDLSSRLKRLDQACDGLEKMSARGPSAPAELVPPAPPAQNDVIRSLERRLSDIDSQEAGRLLSRSRSIPDRSRMDHEGPPIKWTQHFWELGKTAREKEWEDREQSQLEETFAHSFHSMGMLERSTLLSDGVTDLEMINVIQREVSNKF